MFTTMTDCKNDHARKYMTWKNKTSKCRSHNALTKINISTNRANKVAINMLRFDNGRLPNLIIMPVNRKSIRLHLFVKMTKNSKKQVHRCQVTKIDWTMCQPWWIKLSTNRQQKWQMLLRQPKLTHRQNRHQNWHSLIIPQLQFGCE